MGEGEERQVKECELKQDAWSGHPIQDPGDPVYVDSGRHAGRVAQQAIG